jgi:hypothetical protein
LVLLFFRFENAPQRFDIRQASTGVSQNLTRRPSSDGGDDHHFQYFRLTINNTKNNPNSVSPECDFFATR